MTNFVMLKVIDESFDTNKVKKIMLIDETAPEGEGRYNLILKETDPIAQHPMLKAGNRLSVENFKVKKDQYEKDGKWHKINWKPISIWGEIEIRLPLRQEPQLISAEEVRKPITSVDKKEPTPEWMNDLI